jgi:hypothetical protein
MTEIQAPRALLTLGSGPMKPILECTLPTFKAFAARHHYELIVGDVPNPFERPVPWAKISLIQEALKRYGFVLWLDADTIILDDSLDPVDCLPAEAFQAMVRHQSVEEACPNTGVWLLRSCEATHRFLDEVWNQHQFIDDPWWENAAVIDLLGYSLRPTNQERGSRWLSGTHWLANEWNSHVGWNGLVPARIRHYAGVSNISRLRNMTVDYHGFQAARASGVIRYLRLAQFGWGEFKRRPAVVLRALAKRLGKVASQ